jgi:hypothetical protein
MKIILPILLVLTFFTSAFPQNKNKSTNVRTEGFYFNIGIVDGPSFAEFFDYVNDTYAVNSDNKMENFGTTASFGGGYFLRLYPNFALNVGISIYRQQSDALIESFDPEPVSLRHDIDYQVGVFTASVPVLLEFDARQPVVPYAGIGLSIYAMRLDDYRVDNVNFFEQFQRDTNTSVGGQFEVGALIKITSKFWVDGRAAWHSGSGRLGALEPNPPFFLDKYKVEQNVSQFTLGVLYFFR